MAERWNGASDEPEDGLSKRRNEDETRSPDSRILGLPSQWRRDRGLLHGAH